IHDAIASRTYSMIRRVGSQQDIVVIGGMAKNVGLTQALKRRLEVDLTVPAQPQFVGALGAALLAAR
ncbi:MAG: BadF/BadG/BcrA/BcrD ATPase family protein, partial [Dehalococcoidia bacterium]|nr:BadF/BadG/BcrA/BcrD ATPase family protein [Dehalococcoidia bacterium]